MVDISKIRPGDKVTFEITAEVFECQENLLSVRLLYMGTSMEWVLRAERIISHEPRGFNIGDRVIASISGRLGTVKGVHDESESLWVLLAGDKKPITLPIARLKRVK